MMGRRLVRVAAAGLIVGGGLLAGGVASAAPVQTGLPCIALLGHFTSCSIAKAITPTGPAAPTPGMPGVGTAGQIDPNPPAGGGDYSKYDYSNLSWPLYDEGSWVAHPAEDGRRTIDDTIGNGFLGAGVDIDAAANRLQELVSPPKFLGQLDQVVAGATSEVNQALWTPYSLISILVVALMIGLAAWKSEHHRVASMFAWTLLIVGAVSFVTLQSSQISAVADNVLPQITQGVYSHIDGAGTNAAAAAGELEETKVFMPQWCAGELGSDTSKVAVVECKYLFDANGYTVAQAPGGVVSASVTKAKAAEWQQAAATVKKVDPNAYAHITDASGGKASAGIFAFIYSVCTNPLRMVASLMTLVALIILRFEIAIFPAVALVGVNERWAWVIRKMVVSVLVAMVGAVGFSAAAAISIVFDSWLLNPNHLPVLGGTAIAALMFAWAWMMLRPMAALAGMLGMSTQGTSRAQRFARRSTRRTLEAAGIGAGVGAYLERRHEMREEDEPSPGPLYRPEATPGPTVPDVDVRPEPAAQPIPPLPTPAWVDDNPLHPVPDEVTPEPEREVAVA